MINDRYIIKRKLGEGRSKVFLCGDEFYSGRDVAIKILPNDAASEEIKFFKNEFFILQRLNHPNIAKSFEYGTVLKLDGEIGITAGSKFITLEYCEGTRLLDFWESIIAGREASSEEALIKIITQLCSVLFYLHQSNYIYYDLKPENVLVDDDGGRLLIKLIDLGFAQHVVSSEEDIIRGTAEYLAPEILRNEKHDFRVDFYSLGMLLYRIIYGRFPFDVGNEIEIYKAHIENEYEYPETNFSNVIIDVVKKLLKKFPDERFESAIQILNHLNISISENIYKDWLPARTFADRRDYINILKAYINDDSSNEVFSVHGSEGAGKTAIVYKLYSIFDGIILITNGNSLTGINFFKNIIMQVVFNELVYDKLTADLLEKLEVMLQKEPSDLINEARAFFNILTSQIRFTIIFDAFNLYDEFILDILHGVIPIFQVNKIKVILTENADRRYASGFINNLRIVDLTPFTEANLIEYLDTSFSSLFPKDNLKKLILAYADLLPGSLESFLKDIILLRVLRFTAEGIIIQSDGTTEKLLQSSHEEIYYLRVQKLSMFELVLAQMLSSFEISLDDQTVCKLMEITPAELNAVYSGLTLKNILHKRETNSNAVFTAEGLKKYLYSAINDKAKYHGQLADKIKININSFSRNELARQLELSLQFEESYSVLKEEIKEADKQSAFAYEKSLLQHLLTFPLSEEDVFEIKYELCQVYYKLGEYLQMNSLLDELLSLQSDEKIKTELQILKGYCLIGLGDYLNGKIFLESLLEKKELSIKEYQILVKIALAEYNLNQYDDSLKRCNEIINSINSGLEDKANAHEILGLMLVQKSFDLDNALSCFEKAMILFEQSNEKTKAAEMQMNIGLVYYNKSLNEKAKYYWNKSLEIYQNMGNIGRQARIFGNFGLLYFDELEYIKSIECYNNSYRILVTIGDKKSIGVVLKVSGEIYLFIGQFQKSLINIRNSIDIFNSQQNQEEEYESSLTLGKLFFVIGDYENFIKIIIKRTNDKNNVLLNEECNLLYKYLVFLKTMYIDNQSITEKEVKLFLVRLLFYNRKDDYLLFYTETFLFYLQNSLYDLANGLLFDDSFLNLCKNHLYINATRYYLLGILASEIVKSNLTEDFRNLEPAITYFEKSYEILKDLHITELTWKVLYQLAVFYNGRGQKSKAAVFAEDAISLIMYFGNNIEDQSLKNAYFNKPERKSALETLNNITR